MEKILFVFVVVIVNNIDWILLEVIRKGCFDEIFFFGLLNLEERKVIFKVYLSKVCLEKVGKYEIELLGKIIKNFLGVEIE